MPLDNASFDRLVADEFPLDESITYLNHAAVAPWPSRAVAAIETFARENLKTGATHYPEWLKKERSLRLLLKDLVNAESINEIALVKNTSEALSFVAYGLDWKAGDEVVISDQEFPSNRIVWESLQEKFGVRVVQAKLMQAETPEQAVLIALSDKTRLVSISSVQYGTGLKMELTSLGAELKHRNILFCVDAIQSLGVCPTDVQRDNIDFLMADGHKWMLGPEGLGVFYVNKQRLESLQLTQYGWHMVKDRGDYSKDTWEPAPNATRFECGSPNMLGIFALEASLALLAEVGIEEVYGKISANVVTLKALLSDIDGIEFITPNDTDRCAGILTFTIQGRSMPELHQQLMDKNVICASRGGGIRFSPHFYTRKKDLETAAQVLKELLAQ
ncbi:aminotransferase class V-fold PLP-dependent enzyme [Hahella sp. NBU794]|uniref:aminotransferase class V-fold PLP-dependent enzyme n=1 Tax=Hahella sp. NBU794 TaxID=3422590 RepID=UPI003D6EAFE7